MEDLDFDFKKIVKPKRNNNSLINTCSIITNSF
jgi:hypothetical protein